jgi:hypothetical protein
LLNCNSVYLVSWKLGLYLAILQLGMYRVISPLGISHYFTVHIQVLQLHIPPVTLQYSSGTFICKVFLYSSGYILLIVRTCVHQ